MSQENREGQLHQGMQGAAKRDLRPVGYPATVQHAEDDDPQLRDQQDRPPVVGTNVRVCDQMSADVLIRI